MRFFEDLERYADRTVAVDVSGRTYSYKDLIEQSDRFGGALKAGRKNLVFVLCANNFESLCGYVGVLRSGNVGVLLAANTSEDLLTNLIDLYRPDYIWQPRTEGIRTVYDFGEYGLVSADIERSVEIDSRLTLMLSTSGSTGSPKMVRLTADNLHANASSISEYLGLSSSERPITSLPMHYSFGLSVINSHLLMGATLLLTNDSIVTRTFWDFFNQQKATSFSGVPYTYEVLRRFKFFEMDLPTLKSMTQAGGKLTAKFAQEFAEFSHKKGINFFVMYGQTEATARISYLPPKDNLTKYASIGIAIPGGELSLIDESGNLIDTPNVDGELVYRGPNVMLGYAEGEADLSKGDELDGKLITGDIARFDDEGYFYITGRKKRFVKIFGNRVNLDEIEHHLKAAGYTCVCGGRDDLLCIATTDPGKADEIKTRVTQKYSFHHTAVKVIEVKEILKSSSGKIQYEQIFEKVLS